MMTVIQSLAEKQLSMVGCSTGSKSHVRGGVYSVRLIAGRSQSLLNQGSTHPLTGDRLELECVLPLLTF